MNSNSWTRCDFREQIEILEKEKKQYLAKNVNIKEREEQIKQLSDNIVS